MSLDSRSREYREYVESYLKDFYAQRGLLKPVENQPTVDGTLQAILHALGR